MNFVIVVVIVVVISVVVVVFVVSLWVGCDSFFAEKSSEDETEERNDAGNKERPPVVWKKKRKLRIKQARIRNCINLIVEQIKNLLSNNNWCSVEPHINALARMKLGMR